MISSTIHIGAVFSIGQFNTNFSMCIVLDLAAMIVALLVAGCGKTAAAGRNFPVRSV